jgi:excisionase family DNA binding protein
MDEYLRPNEVCTLLHISPRTLFQWTHQGKIRFIKTKGGHYRYPREDLIATEEKTNPINICYCRVSTRGQSDDLQRQVDLFRNRFPHHQIIKDIGSGLNFKRKGLETILDIAIKGDLGEVVVTHKDRLCRFGFDLLEGIISKYSHGKIVVLDHKEISPYQELINDLLSIITVFSSRLYGLRSQSITKKIKDTISQNIEGSIPTNRETKGAIGSDDGAISMVL